MSDYKCKEGMQDNRMVHDTHQEGIKRVMQRGGEKRMGHHGKMGMHGMGGHEGKMHNHTASESNWKRANNANTPRRA